MKPTKGQSRAAWMKMAVAHFLEQGEAAVDEANRKAAELFDQEGDTEQRRSESVAFKASIKKRTFKAEEVAAMCKARGITYREGDEKNIAVIEVTNERVDRDSDVVEVDGIDTKNFLNNPVFMWAHDLSREPVGNVLLLEKERGDKGKALLATVLFHCLTDVSKNVCEMFMLGIVRATSIGFIPKRGGVYFPNETERAASGMQPWGVVFRQCELLEISGCPVPANPYALAREVAKSMSPEGRKFGKAEGLLEEAEDFSDIDAAVETERAAAAAKAASETAAAGIRAKAKAERLKRLQGVVAGNPLLFGKGKRADGIQTPVSRVKESVERLAKIFSSP